jgi:hypothetical protein
LHANASGAPEVNAGKITIVASTKTPTMTIQHSYGSLSVQSQAPGKLFLDGRLMGVLQSGATTKLDVVETGSHTLFIQYDDGLEEREPVVVNNGEAAAVSFSHSVGALPAASFKIDGNFDQWKVIPPALIGNSSENGNLFIDKVYLAVDTQNLYMKFDIKDDTKSSVLHSDNFNTSHDWVAYGLVIRYQNITLGVRVGRHTGQNHWNAAVYKKPDPDEPGVNLAPQAWNCALKGSSLEAASPLKPIRDYFGPLAPGTYYTISAYASYWDGNARNSLSITSLSMPLNP